MSLKLITVLFCLLLALPVASSAALAETADAATLRSQAFELISGTAQDKTKAIALFAQAAAAGDVASMAFLGDIYLNGNGVHADRQLAIQWYLKAAQAGNAAAAAKLAEIAGGTDSAPPSSSSSAAVPAPAAEQAPQTQVASEDVAAARDGVVPSDEALDLESQADDEYFGDDGDIARALDLYAQAAEAGNPKAAWWLGVIYERPLHKVKQNYKLALKYLQLGADGGNSAAMIELGELYANGHGVKKDVHKYFDLITRSADLGDPNAYFLVALAYYNGVGVQQDCEESFTWSVKAADAHHVDGTLIVGLRYPSGQGVGKDSQKAADYVYQAIKMGSEFGRDSLFDGTIAPERNFRSRLQQLLSDDGYYDGPVDGSFGPQSRRAIETAFGTEKPD